jgi:predicted peptidase
MQATVSSLATQVVKPVDLRYLLWQPPDLQQAARWPLILFLHGSGERGGDLALVTRCGLPARLERDLELPCFVAAPQCDAGSDWELQADALLALLDDLQARLPIDPQRIYLTGLSMGGRGAWLLGAFHPERFAALVPICGRRPGPVRFKERAATMRGLPIWAFHGARDTVVPVGETRQAVAALREAGLDVRSTIYPLLDHDSWTRAYAEPELWPWMFAQRRVAR